MYYIISLKHTKKWEDYVTLWRPDNAGYCYSRDNVGVYNELIPDYHDTINELPITAEQADKLFIETVYDGKQQMMIPNCKAVWDVLGVKYVKGNLTKTKGAK